MITYRDSIFGGWWGYMLISSGMIGYYRYLVGFVDMNQSLISGFYLFFVGVGVVILAIQDYRLYKRCQSKLIVYDCIFVLVLALVPLLPVPKLLIVCILIGVGLPCAMLLPKKKAELMDN